MNLCRVWASSTFNVSLASSLLVVLSSQTYCVPSLSSQSSYLCTLAAMSSRRVGDDYIPALPEFSSLPVIPPAHLIDTAQWQGPTEESNWVLRPSLLVGAYPCSQHDPTTSEILTSILGLGVTTFVCLQEEYQHDVTEEEWRSGAKLRPYIFDAIRLVDALPPTFFKGGKISGLEFVHFPIRDCGIAHDNSVLQLARDLCARLLKGEVMYLVSAHARARRLAQLASISALFTHSPSPAPPTTSLALQHCWGGHGRTGTVVSLMLGIMYGLPPLQAMRWVQFVHDLRLAPMGTPSPQTEAQRQQVIRILNAIQRAAPERGLTAPPSSASSLGAGAGAAAQAPSTPRGVSRGHHHSAHSRGLAALSHTIGGGGQQASARAQAAAMARLSGAHAATSGSSAGVLRAIVAAAAGGGGGGGGGGAASARGGAQHASTVAAAREASAALEREEARRRAAAAAAVVAVAVPAGHSGGYQHRQQQYASSSSARGGAESAAAAAAAATASATAAAAAAAGSLGRGGARSQLLQHLPAPPLSHTGAMAIAGKSWSAAVRGGGEAKGMAPALSASPRPEALLQGGGGAYTSLQAPLRLTADILRDPRAVAIAPLASSAGGVGGRRSSAGGGGAGRG